MDRNRLIRIPLAVNLDTQASTGVFSRGAYLRNAQVRARYNQDVYVTQRPGVLMLEDASDKVSTRTGRGIYYWDTTGSLYFVNGNTLYRNTYSNPIGTLDDNTQRVYLVALGDYLVVTSPQSGTAWVVTPENTVTKITDPDFPTTLAGGAVTLDGYLFVMDTEATLYQSDRDDPTSWNALNFITAEREPDGGVFLAKHHNSLVAVGTRTVEFFYDAANPQGSVLNRRDDVFFSLGAVDHNGYAENGDSLIFVGNDRSGSLSVYLLADLTLTKISTPVVDSYLTDSYYNRGKGFLCAIQGALGKTFYCVTTTTPDNSDTTLVYDVEAQLWYVWDTQILNHSDLSLVGTTVAEFPCSLMRNGDRVRLSYNDTTADYTVSSYYVEQGYLEEGYLSDGTSANQSPILMECVTYPVDSGSRTYKFMHSVELVNNNQSDPASMTLGITDDNYNSYREYPLPLMGRRKLSRLGRYSNRALRLKYSGAVPLQLSFLEACVDDGEF